MEPWQQYPTRFRRQLAVLLAVTAVLVAAVFVATVVGYSHMGRCILDGCG